MLYRTISVATFQRYIAIDLKLNRMSFLTKRLMYDVVNVYFLKLAMVLYSGYYRDACRLAAVVRRRSSAAPSPGRLPHVRRYYQSTPNNHIIELFTDIDHSLPYHSHEPCLRARCQRFVYPCRTFVTRCNLAFNSFKLIVY